VTNNIVPADLGDIAGRINAAHDRASAAARSAIEHAIECGRLLTEAKAQLPHGLWLPWLEANTVVGVRQAQRFCCKVCSGRLIG
jgi:hypothetical protein